MIGKIKKGTSFYGLLWYLARNPWARRLETTVRERTRDAAADLAQVAAQGRALTKPVRHLMVRLPAQEHLTDEQWRYVASTVLERMGYGDCPYVLTLHDEPDGQHLHIATTARTYAGRHVSDSNDHHRIQEVLRDLERELGLAAPVPRAKRVSQAEGPYRTVLESGRNPDAPAVAACIDFHAAASSSFDELSRRLAGEGIEIRASWGRDGRLRGLSFETETGEVFKASMLDRISRRKCRLWETFPALEHREAPATKTAAISHTLQPAEAVGPGGRERDIKQARIPTQAGRDDERESRLLAGLYPALAASSSFESFTTQLEPLGFRPVVVERRGHYGLVFEELQAGSRPLRLAASGLDPSLGLPRLARRFPHVFSGALPRSFHRTLPVQERGLVAFRVEPAARSRLKLDARVVAFRRDLFFVREEDAPAVQIVHRLVPPRGAAELGVTRATANPFGLAAERSRLLRDPASFRLGRLRGLAQEVLRAQPDSRPQARALHQLARLERLARHVAPQAPALLTQVFLDQPAAPPRAFRPSQPDASARVALTGPRQERERLRATGLEVSARLGQVWVPRDQVAEVLRSFPLLRENPWSPKAPPPPLRYEPRGMSPELARPDRLPQSRYVDLVSRLTRLETEILARHQAARLRQSDPPPLPKAYRRLRDLREALYLRALASPTAGPASRSAALRAHRLAARLLAPRAPRAHPLHRTLAVADRLAARDPRQLPPALLLLARATREPSGSWSVRSPEQALTAFRHDRSSANLLNLATALPELRRPRDADELGRYLRAERRISGQLLRLSRSASPDLARASTLAADLLALRRAVNTTLRHQAGFRQPRAQAPTRSKAYGAAGRSALLGVRLAARAAAYGAALNSDDPALALTRVLATSLTPVRHIARLAAALERTDPLTAIARLYVVDGAVRAVTVLAPQPLGIVLTTARTVFQALRTVIQTASPHRSRAR